jgi:hypothetical protein
VTCPLFQGATVERWDVSPEVYFADRDAISQSTLKTIADSPRSHAEGVERPDTDALICGRRFHRAVLQPDLWLAECRGMAGAVVKPKFVGAGARTTQPAEWLASLPPGTAIISEAERESWDGERAKVDGMAAALHEHELAGKLLARDAEVEMPLRWTDPETGLRCRCLVDHLSLTTQATIVDLKSTRDPTPDGFAKSVANYRYHWQAAWYSDAVALLTGLPVRFYLAVVRSAPPFEAAVYEISDDDLDLARRQVRAAMQQAREHTDTQDWRAEWERGLEPITLRLPRWATMERT